MRRIVEDASMGQARACSSRAAATLPAAGGLSRLERRRRREGATEVGSPRGREALGGGDGLVAELEAVLGRRVDVVAERGLMPALRSRVLSEAVPVQ